MIKVTRVGKYKLIETKQRIKILYLDQKPYVWLFVPGIGYLLEITSKPHIASCVLACGSYRLYDVKDETQLESQAHLELYVGEGYWQGYLLLTGLPSISKKKRPHCRYERDYLSWQNIV
jgi:hypothetical protein